MVKTNRNLNKLSPELERIKNVIVPILKSNGIKKAGIFGSYVRNEQNKDSDIDILIDFHEGLFKLAGIKIKLEKELDREVDLLTYNGIHPFLKEQILNEEVKII
jgi:uncharacterized protein